MSNLLSNLLLFDKHVGADEMLAVLPKSEPVWQAIHRSQSESQYLYLDKSLICSVRVLLCESCGILNLGWAADALGGEFPLLRAVRCRHIPSGSSHGFLLQGKSSNLKDCRVCRTDFCRRRSRMMTTISLVLSHFRHFRIADLASS